MALFLFLDKEIIKTDLGLSEQKVNRLEAEAKNNQFLLECKNHEIQALQAELKGLDDRLKASSEGKLQNTLEREQIEFREMALKHPHGLKRPRSAENECSVNEDEPESSDGFKKRRVTHDAEAEADEGMDEAEIEASEAEEDEDAEEAEEEDEDEEAEDEDGEEVDEVMVEGEREDVDDPERSRPSFRGTRSPSAGPYRETTRSSSASRSPDNVTQYLDD